jgi:hypothetical protein
MIRDDCNKPPLVAGLYPDSHHRFNRRFKPGITREVASSWIGNPLYFGCMIFLAVEQQTAASIEAFGFLLGLTFKDAPGGVWRDSARKRDHRMGLPAAREFGEHLGVDGDTAATIPPDGEFGVGCRAGGTPKFVLLPGCEHAIENCGGFYAFVPLAGGDFNGAMAIRAAHGRVLQRSEVSHAA